MNMFQIRNAVAYKMQQFGRLLIRIVNKINDWSFKVSAPLPPFQENGNLRP